ncbi:MAG: RNA polymerase sigma-70 factor [Agriterribacter sp.]
MTYHEQELLLGLRRGSEEAFTLLYKQHSIPLYYNILSLVKDAAVAEELVQDVFSKIWNQRASIQIEKSFSGYLFVTARNRVYDFFQQLQRDQVLRTRIMEMATAAYEPIEQAIFAKENAAMLRKAIETLPPQRRRAFELCKLEGLTYRQASEEMGISLSTIKDHMVHALDAIRVYILQHVEVAGMLVFYCIFQLP